MSDLNRTRPITEYAVCFCKDGEHANDRRVRRARPGYWTRAGAEDYIAGACGERTDYHLVTREVVIEATSWQMADEQPTYGLHHTVGGEDR